ncbi:MAG TPA: response regulator [Acidobacteriota bacterium]|nr:response regulator [Acidobacteriota bacterium]
MTERYDIKCSSCGTTFDGVTASWCMCVGGDQTLSCPKCNNCFCRASKFYIQTFWDNAPQIIWDRKNQEIANLDADNQLNPAPSEVKHPCVLVVDDDATIRKLARKLIRGFGYGVLIASNGHEGLQMAKVYKPELVLMDALMPGLDGWQMCKEIKRDPQLSKTKAVIMTSLYKHSKYKTDAFKEAQVDDYAIKPLQLKDLRGLLRKFLN